MKPEKTPDPVLDEIREVRRQISAQFDHDPKKLVDHYIELQRLHGDRLLDSPDEALIETALPD